MPQWLKGFLSKHEDLVQVLDSYLKRQHHWYASVTPALWVGRQADLRGWLDCCQSSQMVSSRLSERPCVGTYGDGAGETALQLKVLPALAEDQVPCSVPTWWLTTAYTSSSGNLTPSPGLRAHQAHTWHKHKTYLPAKYPYTNDFK